MQISFLKQQYLYNECCTRNLFVSHYFREHGFIPFFKIIPGLNFKNYLQNWFTRHVKTYVITLKSEHILNPNELIQLEHLPSLFISLELLVSISKLKFSPYSLSQPRGLSRTEIVLLKWVYINFVLVSLEINFITFFTLISSSIRLTN